MGFGGDDSQVGIFFTLCCQGKLRSLLQILPIQHPTSSIQHQLKCSFPFLRPVELSERWSEDDARDRFTVFDQGDIDGEFAVFLDKLFGTVDGINTPIPLPVFALFVGDIFTLFGEDGKRTDFLEPFGDDLVSFFVGFGERGFVIFVLNIEILFVNLHDSFAGVESDGDHLVHIKGIRH